MVEKMTQAAGIALAGQIDELDPHIRWPKPGTGVDPMRDNREFFQKLLHVASNIPAVDQPGFSPPYVFFDDFFFGSGEMLPYNLDDPETDGQGFKFGTVNEYNDWMVSGTNNTTSVIAPVDACPGGWMSFETAGAEEDACQCQLLGSSFMMRSGKPLYFEVRMAVKDFSECTWYIGLAPKNTTEVTDSGSAYGNMNDFVGFYGIEEANINYASSEDGNDSNGDTGEDFADCANAAAIVTAATNVIHRLGFYWDGVDTLTFYVDGVATDTLNTTDDDINDDVWLSPVIAVDATGGGTTEKIFVDYIYVAQKR